MEKTVINDIELEHETKGDAEEKSNIFIHGGIIADANIPLFSEPSLKNYLLVHYHRRGYAGSSKDMIGVSISDQAVDCKGLGPFGN